MDQNILTTKKSHSIVLLAVCNARYEFTLVDIGDAGRQSDGGVYKNSNLGHAIDNNTINRPPASPINSSGKEYPYVFVTDDAFQMKPLMLRWMYTKIFVTKKFFVTFEIFMLINTFKHGESNGCYDILKS